MNFYARQEAARRRTRRLIFLFLLGMIGVAAAVNLVVLTLLASGDANGPVLPSGEWLRLHSGSAVVTTLIVLAVIGLSSLFKTATLHQGGGGAVARSLGGTRIDRSGQDPLQRRLYNVVEEMAIASGVAVPEIYVLEQETGINAFAAGHSPANAAIAVTRGALENLNRAELQGVIAHEFSHVLNGDMRLNTRLLGLLFGLLVVALIGRTVLRWAPGRTSSRGKGGGGVAVILLAAVAVMILGYVGVFFGRLIQAAVSRQRETLADASAVQFTREPQGLRGALVKIGAADGGSKLATPQTDEVAHMLFASGMTRMFATHPPILERIRALDPSFDPREFAKVRLHTPEVEEGVEPAGSPAAVASFAGGADAGASDIAKRVGAPGTAEVVAAQAISRSLPTSLISGLETPGRAVGALLALVLDSNPEVRARQDALISSRLGAKTLEFVAAVEPDVKNLMANQRLPVLSHVLPALRRLPRETRRRLLEILQPLIVADDRIDVFEYAVATVARQYLRDELDAAAAPSGQLKLDEVTEELQIVFSVLARHGADSEAQARRAYEMGMSHLLPQHRPAYALQADWAVALDRALARLERLVPIAREQLIEALVKTIAHDGRLSVSEAELLRAICASLHSPLPPLTGLAGADLRVAVAS